MKLGSSRLAAANSSVEDDRGERGLVVEPQLGDPVVGDVAPPVAAEAGVALDVTTQARQLGHDRAMHVEPVLLERLDVEIGSAVDDFDDLDHQHTPFTGWGLVLDPLSIIAPGSIGPRRRCWIR